MIKPKGRKHDNCEICDTHPLFDLDEEIYIHGEHYSKEYLLEQMRDRIFFAVELGKRNSELEDSKNTVLTQHKVFMAQEKQIEEYKACKQKWFDECKLLEKDNDKLQRDYSHLLKQKKDCEDRSYSFEQKADSIYKLIRHHVEEDGYIDPEEGLDRIAKLIGYDPMLDGSDL